MRRRHKFLLFRVYRFRDSQAYGELYDVYVSRIHRFIAFRVGRPEDADELTAEVFLRGWEYATSSMVEKPKALFYRIARNVVADHYRKKERQGEEMELEAAANIETELPDAAEQLQLKQEHARLLESMKSLKEEYRDVLMMKYLDELTTREIAEALEKTPNNVRVTLHRAKKALQDIIETS